MHLVFCETGHGTRYHRFTDTPEEFSADLVWGIGGIEDPDGAVESGYVQPDEWDDNGDLIAAAGEVADEYLAWKEREEYLASGDRDDNYI